MCDSYHSATPHTYLSGCLWHFTDLVFFLLHWFFLFSASILATYFCLWDLQASLILHKANRIMLVKYLSKQKLSSLLWSMYDPTIWLLPSSVSHCVTCYQWQHASGSSSWLTVMPYEAAGGDCISGLASMWNTANAQNVNRWFMSRGSVPKGRKYAEGWWWQLPDWAPSMHTYRQPGPADLRTHAATSYHKCTLICTTSEAATYMCLPKTMAADNVHLLCQALTQSPFSFITISIPPYSWRKGELPAVTSQVTQVESGKARTWSYS